MSARCGGRQAGGGVTLVCSSSDRAARHRNKFINKTDIYD
jgi:hypothetical protein